MAVLKRRRAPSGAGGGGSVRGSTTVQHGDQAFQSSFKDGSISLPTQTLGTSPDILGTSFFTFTPSGSLSQVMLASKAQARLERLSRRCSHEISVLPKKRQREALRRRTFARARTRTSMLWSPRSSDTVSATSGATCSRGFLNEALHLIPGRLERSPTPRSGDSSVRSYSYSLEAGGWPIPSGIC